MSQNLVEDAENGFLHQPPNTMPEIKELWMFVSVDEDGNEGVCGMPTSLGTMPMFATDTIRLADLEPVAKILADRSGMKIQLIRLSNREVVKEIK